MSDMLEQAIIDADALKEAAVKNAETLVLEKYSSQIKEAVTILLEQDDPAAMAMDPMAGLGGEADPAAAMGMPGLGDPMPGMEVPAAPYEESSVMEHIPLAATTKTDEKIEIPLDKLMEELEIINQKMLYDGDSVLNEVGAFHEDLDEEIYEYLDEELDEDLDEELDLSEENLDRVVEQLTIDINPRKSGWAGTPEAVMHLAEEELLALEQDSAIRERHAAMRKAVHALEKVNEAVIKQNTKLQDAASKSAAQINKLSKVVHLMKEKIDITNLTNAKLLYQNKALTSDSLNERQKHKLAEAVSNADTIEEAKVIFETLQSTVGSTSRKRKSQPKSLSEAVEKSSSMILSARKQSSSRQKHDPTIERWKFLAGIDKK